MISELSGARFWIRTVPKVIDFIVLLLVLSLSGPLAYDLPRTIFIALTGKTISWQTFHYSGSIWGDVLGILLVSILYFSLFEALYGATPGKLVCGLRVLKEDGSPCGLMSAVGRSVALIVDGAIFGLVAAVSMRASLLHQRLGDKWFHTVVVSGRDLRPGALCRFLLACLLYIPLALILASLIMVLDRLWLA